MPLRIHFCDVCEENSRLLHPELALEFTRMPDKEGSYPLRIIVRMEDKEPSTTFDFEYKKNDNKE